MSQEKSLNRKGDPLVKANEHANGIFAKMAAEVESQMKAGVSELDVLKISRQVGLELTEEDLDNLQVNRIILPHPFLPWHIWYPWRPIWCWWWRRYYPYYRCCWWWWTRCHWYRH